MTATFGAIGAGSADDYIFGVSGASGRVLAVQTDTVPSGLGLYAVVEMWINPTIYSDPTSAGISVTIGSSTMTFVGYVPIDSTHWIGYYILANPPTGSQTITTFGNYNVSQGYHIETNAFYYTGVIGYDSTLQSTSGTTGSLSQAVTGAGANDIILQTFVTVGATAITSYNKTSRWAPGPYTYDWPMVVGESVGGSTVTFTASSTGATGWTGAALILHGVGPIVIAPAGQTVTETPGTPTILTGGPKTVTPAGATVAATPGTPKVGPVFNPFEPVFQEMLAGHDITLLALGDSTIVGYNDGFAGGWVVDVQVALALYFDYNILGYGWNSGTRVWTSGLDNGTGYFYQSPNSGRPTMHGMGAAQIGTTISYDIGNINGGMFVDAMAYTGFFGAKQLIPNITIVGDGLNDFGQPPNASFPYTYFHDGIQEFVDAYNTAWDGVSVTPPPIILTSENPSNAGSNTYTPSAINDSLDCAGFQSLAQWLGLNTFVPFPGFDLTKDLLFQPVLAAGEPILQETNIDNVSFMDTRQYTIGLYQALGGSALGDGIHLNHFGYQVQANGVLDNWTNGLIAPRLIGPSEGAPTIVSTMGTPPILIDHSETPTQANLTITTATPTLLLPNTEKPTGATATATPGTAGVNVPYSGAPAGATVAATPGTPAISILSPSTVVTVGGANLHATPGTPKILLQKTNAIWFLGVQGSFVGQRIITAAQWERRLGAGSWEDTVWEADNGWAVPAAQLTSQQINVILQDVEFVFGQLGDRHS